MNIKDFVRISKHRWLYEKRDSMNTNAVIFSDEEGLNSSIEDNSISQVLNVARLPHIVGNSIAMPDIHYGYGFCIGGVAAFDGDNGIVLPGGVGYDINCGVRLIKTNIMNTDLNEKLKDRIGIQILKRIPSGLTSKINYKFSNKEFLKFIKRGASEVVNKVKGYKDDLNFIEDKGKLDFERIEVISERAIERGKKQLGSLGSGNHFIEIQTVDKIYDKSTADVLGVEKGQILIMIHTGSRGFGHQIASDYIEKFRKKNISRVKPPDPQLIFSEINSKIGKDYLEALNAASNFAWANRHLIMEDIIDIFEEIFNSSRNNLGIKLIYDQAHNIAKFETHTINGKSKNLLVHRKGATRAFPPNSNDIPVEYKKTGQPVIIPGSMGTSSYLLTGAEKSMELSLGSSAHGAGRRLSRHKAIRNTLGIDVRDEMKKKNILVYSFSNKGLREEYPIAYKDIDNVVKITNEEGISKKVLKLIPLIVVKG